MTTEFLTVVQKERLKRNAKIAKRYADICESNPDVAPTRACMIIARELKMSLTQVRRVALGTKN